MANIRWDLINGNDGTIDRNGFTGTRVCHVSGLTSSNGYAKINEAIAAVNIPLGTPHPTYTDSALKSIGATSLDSGNIQISLNYIPVLNVPYDIQISSSANNAQTNKDKDDTTITVSYTYPEDYQGDPNKISKTETVGKTIDTRVPTTTITIKKRELTTGTDLVTLSQNYVATVNLANWNIRPSDDARTWLCSSITGDYVCYYIDGATTHYVYDTTYVFDNNYGGFDTEVVFIDPTTGESPNPATWISSTSKTIQVLQEANFTNLTSDIS